MTAELLRDDFRLELLRRFRTQRAAAASLGIRESRLSQIVRGWDEPSAREYQALKAALGARRLTRLLKTEPREGSDRLQQNRPKEATVR